MSSSPSKSSASKNHSSKLSTSTVSGRIDTLDTVGTVFSTVTLLCSVTEISPSETVAAQVISVFGVVFPGDSVKLSVSDNTVSSASVH